MPPTDSFAEWKARLRAGDRDAATEVWQRFKDRLIGLARSRMAAWLRRKEDPEDVVQSVYKSLFAGSSAGRFDFDTWNDLWSLLTVITVWKCGKRVEYFRAGCRDALREVSAGPGDDALDCLQMVLDPEPTPAEAAILTETVEALLRGLDAEDREVIELILQGYSVPQISERLDLSERTVKRVRDRAKKRLQHLQAEGETPS